MDFKLRRPRMSDLDSFADNIIDPIIDNAFMSNPKNKSEARLELEQTIAVNNKSDTDTYFIIINNKPVGEISLSEIIKGHKAKLSFWLGKDYRGKGIMTKAIRHMLRIAKNRHKVVRVYAFVRSFNKASAKVLEKSGFKLEGILRKNKKKNDRFFDDLVYARVR